VRTLVNHGMPLTLNVRVLMLVGMSVADSHVVSSVPQLASSLPSSSRSVRGSGTALTRNGVRSPKSSGGTELFCRRRVDM